MKAFWKWLLSLFNPARPSPQPVVYPDPVTPMPVPVTQPNIAILKRTYKNNETLGLMTATRADGQTLNLKTLELPWLENQHNISCIPAGTYHVEMHPFHTTEMYQIMNVPNRTGIFQHPANFTSDILGCQAIGEQFGDINGDGLTDVTNTVEAVAQLKAFFNNQPYTLTIT